MTGRAAEGKPHLGILIPAHSEEANLPALYAELRSAGIKARTSAMPPRTMIVCHSPTRRSTPC